jgi:N-carbamoylputrescine amidase
MGQMRCVGSDVEGNRERIRRMAGEARRQGAAMAFFPETVDFGWVNPAAHERAGPIPGPFSEHVAAVAREFDLWIGVGCCEKADGVLYDSAILMDPAGRIVLRHRKINLLAWLMEPPYTPGDPGAIDVVETPFGRIGMLICADSFQADLLARLAEKRPDLVYIPYGWAEEKTAWPEHGFKLLTTVQRAARTLAAPVIGPNLLGTIEHGDWKGRTFEGLSTAADATGLSLVQGPWNREAVISFEVTG